MLKKQFGDLTVPAIGQGTGGNDVVEDALRIRVIQYGIDLGMTLIDTTPRIGAEGYKIAFIHPNSTGGILIELCEKN